MKRKLKIMFSVLLVIVIVLGLSACSVNDVSSADSVPTQAAKVEETEAAKAAETAAEVADEVVKEAEVAGDDIDKSQLKIGICQIQYTTPWRITETNSVLRALYEDGYTNIIYTNAGGDVQKEVANGEDLIAQGIDLLLLSPMDINGLTPVLEAAKSAGVPVVLNDRKANGVAGEDYITLVAQDQVLEGKLVGDWIYQEYGDEPVNIVEIQGNPVSSSVIDREAGFQQSLKEHPNFNLVASQVGNDTLAEAHTVMTNILQAHGPEDIDVVFAFCSQMAIGAAQAMREFGIEPGKDIKIATIDGMPTDLEAIINGDFSCVIQCNPFLGDKTVEVVNRVLINNESTDTIGEAVLVEDAVFTKENAPEALKVMNEQIEHDQAVADLIIK